MTCRYKLMNAYMHACMHHRHMAGDLEILSMRVSRLALDIYYTAALSGRSSFIAASASSSSSWLYIGTRVNSTVMLWLFRLYTRRTLDCLSTCMRLRCTRPRALLSMHVTELTCDMSSSGTVPAAAMGAITSTSSPPAGGSLPGGRGPGGRAGRPPSSSPRIRLVGMMAYAVRSPAPDRPTMSVFERRKTCLTVAKSVMNAASVQDRRLVGSGLVWPAVLFRISVTLQCRHSSSRRNHIERRNTCGGMLLTVKRH